MAVGTKYQSIEEVPVAADDHKSSDAIYDQIDVNIGSDQLRDCRVTIDYKRKKVLIERTVDIRNADFHSNRSSNPLILWGMVW